MDRRAVIFDMDGVLIDSYHAHLEAWQRMGEKLGRPVTEEAFVPTFGRVNREISIHCEFRIANCGLAVEGCSLINPQSAIRNPQLSHLQMASPKPF